MLEKNFKSAVKSILGTCASIGILVENQAPNELIHEIEDGRFDREIKDQISETSPEKRNRLNDFFNEIKRIQEAKIEAAKKAAEAEEAAKTEAAAKPAAAVEPGKTAVAQAAGAKTEPPVASKSTPAKKEEKKILKK